MQSYKAWLFILTLSRCQVYIIPT